jgi:adenylate kinase
LSKKQPELGKIISQCYLDGESIPDAVINSLVEQRLKQSDCRVNGWVLEGFPETEAQCNLLKAMKVTPSVIFMFEQMESESVAKLYKRRVDPKTGTIYNLDLVRMRDKHLTKLMIEAAGDASLLAQLGL